MAEHRVTVFHLIKSSGWPAQMLCGLRLKGVLTFGEKKRPPVNLTLGFRGDLHSCGLLPGMIAPST